MLRENLSFSRLPFYIPPIVAEKPTTMRVIREIWNDWTRFHLQRSKERGTEKERIYRDSNSTTLVERNDATFDSRFISVRIMRLRPVENPNVQRWDIYVSFPFLLSTPCHLAISSSKSSLRLRSLCDLILRHVPSVREKEREGKTEKERERVIEHRKLSPASVSLFALFVSSSGLEGSGARR